MYIKGEREIVTNQIRLTGLFYFLDLTIGTFESHHVVILRTRPVAKPHIQSITFHNADQRNQQSIQKLLLDQERFSVKVCLNFRFSTNRPLVPQLGTCMT